MPLKRIARALAYLLSFRASIEFAFILAYNPSLFETYPLLAKISFMIASISPFVFIVALLHSNFLDSALLVPVEPLRSVLLSNFHFLYDGFFY